jgi:prepilin-type N-terminal cleavage/methylation domain-containing protein
LHNHRLSRQGFTLVELSIVLVVIGLLIGGILIGQSMLSSAKINAQIKQIQQFDIASSSYISKFRAFPGDNDRDGILECSAHASHLNQICPYANGYSYGNDGETFRFFYDLSSRIGFPGGYKAPPGGYTFSGNVVSQPMVGTGRFIPEAAIGRGGIYATHNANKNLYWMTGLPKGSMNGEKSWTPYDVTPEGFTPKEAMAMDSKIEDSNSRSGDVSATWLHASGLMRPFRSTDPNYALRFDDNYVCSDNTGKYKHATETRPLCALQFKSGASLNNR